MLFILGVFLGTAVGFFVAALMTAAAASDAPPSRTEYGEFSRPAGERREPPVPVG
jgi:hypothetical protein